MKSTLPDMAYDPIAQGDRDILSEGSDSVVSGSSPPDDSFRPISMQFENTGELNIETGETNGHADTRLGSLMRSMASTGTSYDMLEDDDYEDTHQTPVKNKRKNIDASFGPPQPHSSVGRLPAASIGPKLPLRHPTPDLQSVQGAYFKNVERLEESAERLSMTSSMDGELQKLKFERRQGQRHSSAPSEHAHPTQHTSRQVSTSSLSNSIIGVNASPTSAGHPLSQHVISPKGSVLSGSCSHTSNPGRSTSKSSRFAQPLADHDFAQTSPEHFRQYASPTDEPPQPPPHTYRPEKHARRLSLEQSPEYDTEKPDEFRPSTSASNDTYRQATDLFVDFDGVHFTSHSHLSPNRQVSINRQIATNQPPLAIDAPAFTEPPLDEGMVYYPAPVPVMLNLPQKLSKQPSPAERERRRLKALSAMPTEMRKSAAWLNKTEKTTSADGTRTSQALSSLPPQLRASAFFEKPALTQDIDIKCASAVDTLDSILDASAHAPVSAFTDHPFAGHLGGEIYGKRNVHDKGATLETKKNRRSSITNLLRTSTGPTLDTKHAPAKSPTGPPIISQNKLTKRRSKLEINEREAALVGGEGTPLTVLAESTNAKDEVTQSNAEDLEDEDSKEAIEEDNREEEDLDTPTFSGPPTTLLAELQMRKAQQRQRNRTAANAFPNGMHSTLLELDAVAQFQQKSRKKKHITLAWEDSEVDDEAKFDDDDIPLGLLVAGQKAQQNIDRPMGLMEKRDMEDNEPLSCRRARLRGDEVNPQAVILPEQQRASTMYTLDLPALADKGLDEDEGETLAQRIQRIKAEKGTTTGVGAEFTSEISSLLGLKTENVAPAATTPEAEETLGQRRKRLQDEALKGSRQPSAGSVQKVLEPKPPSSMADLLGQHPAVNNRLPSKEARTIAQQNTSLNNVGQHNSSLSMHTFQHPVMNPYNVPGTMPAYPSFNSGMPYASGVAGFNYNNPIYSPGLAIQVGRYGQNAYLHDQIMMGPPLDAKQRDMIDRWRQDVAP
ncbi:hypothetical protein GJ744_002955 [Endocarpon pusillum]|uniref:Uncharacterized protein n=1 Tax=Endocarpon pusillum TaxID=364733 RepID=A0A8H7E2D7_9EURO|nr:hypothetical protein GJ744_002955 [Endocarpon pusillum]